jgi:hypothetical protein
MHLPLTCCYEILWEKIEEYNSSVSSHAQTNLKVITFTRNKTCSKGRVYCLCVSFSLQMRCRIIYCNRHCIFRRQVEIISIVPSEKETHTTQSTTFHNVFCSQTSLRLCLYLHLEFVTDCDR